MPLLKNKQKNPDFKISKDVKGAYNWPYCKIHLDYVYANLLGCKSKRNVMVPLATWVTFVYFSLINKVVSVTASENMYMYIYIYNVGGLRKCCVNDCKLNNQETISKQIIGVFISRILLFLYRNIMIVITGKQKNG